MASIQAVWETLEEIAKKDGRYDSTALMLVLDAVISVNGPNNLSPRSKGLNKHILKTLYKSYGMMAKLVMKKWRVTKPEDFAIIAELLCEGGLVPKTRFFKYSDFAEIDLDSLDDFNEEQDEET
jgi:uncharacterized repeat protein (TIGR04138 family)